MTLDVARFFQVTEVTDGPRWRVGPGDKRHGLAGQQIAVIALKHARGYEVVLQLDNGKIDSFAPFQLFPDSR